MCPHFRSATAANSNGEATSAAAATSVRFGLLVPSYRRRPHGSKAERT